MRLSLAAILFALLACAHIEETPPLMRALEPRCASRGGDACRELGWMTLRRSANAAGDREAARLFMEGCETKDAQSCADLGALYAAGRGVRQDDARACALGLPDACSRAGLRGLDAPRKPTAAVTPTTAAADGLTEEDVRRDADALENAEAYARYFVDVDLHERLGATHAGLVAEPPAPEDDVQLIRRLVSRRRWAVSHCLPVYVYPDRHAASARAWVSFVVGGDGRTSAVRVAAWSSRDPEAEEHERCIADAVARWEFPAPRVGGRLWVRFDGTGPRRDAPAVTSPSEAPFVAANGYTRPAMERSCVEKRVHLPSSLTALVRRSMLTRQMTVRFAVGANGDVSRFLVVGPPEAPVALARMVEQAVVSCPWMPGTDGEGRPASSWVVLPIRFR